MEVSKTLRDISFCGRTILDGEILEVPNALEDERFRDSPLVTGDSNVRFYAGAPLVTPDGHMLGLATNFSKPVGLIAETADSSPRP